jgi:hypothetical protein
MKQGLAERLSTVRRKLAADLLQVQLRSLANATFCCYGGTAKGVQNPA